MPVNFSPLITVSGTKVTVPANPVTPNIPSDFIPKSEERFVSFVLELDNEGTDADIGKLKHKLNEVFSTKLSGYFPEMLYGRSTIWKSIKRNVINKKVDTKSLFLEKDNITKRLSVIKQSKFPQLPYRLERLFPGAEKDYKSSKKFGLHRFFLVTLPVYERLFKSKTTEAQFQRHLFQISKELKSFCALSLAKPALQYPDYQLLSMPCSCTTFNNPDNWPLDKINATQLPAGIDGRNILIGHIDTGWTLHHQLNFDVTGTSPNYDLANDWNVLNGENSAREPLDHLAINPFHGTATGSLMISNPKDDSPGGKQDAGTPDNAPLKKVTGVAIGAKILPIRCVDTVILIGDVEVARSVWYATQKNVDIISMSLGGYPAPELECVVAHAVYNNIITVAAAGNYYPLVVFPAAYEECIAVGGSSVFNQPWSSSAKGPKVAISAPAECVQCADWDGSPNKKEIINLGACGTSFSVAFVAGAAALWLQRHGKTNLLNRMNGIATLQELFLQHMKETATPHQLPGNTNENGAGILNVQGLLNPATLPDQSNIQIADWNNWLRITTMEVFYDIFENTDPVVVRRKMELGNVHINKISDNGKVGKLVGGESWTDGWTTTEIFKVGITRYLFLLKESSGVVHINKINLDGTIGPLIKTYNWSSGWTSAKFYTIGVSVFVLLLKESTGEVHIHNIDIFGKIANRIATYNWSGGWTTVETYTVALTTYLFLLKRSDGTVHIQKINLDGTVGSRIATYNWSSGWTSAKFYTIGVSVFVLLLKESSGDVHIHNIDIFGKIANRVATHNWSGGWSNVEFYSVGLTTYLFLLKRTDGAVHIQKMNLNGTVGNRIDTHNWSSGWTSAKLYTIGTGVYLFLLKRERLS